MTKRIANARVLQRAMTRERTGRVPIGTPIGNDAWDAAFNAPIWVRERYPEDELYAERILAYIAQKYPNAMYDARARIWIGLPESADPSAQPEYAPKGTDEVAPTDEPIGDGDLHGGDNASQEVPDGESAGGEKPSETGEIGEGGDHQSHLSPDGTGSGGQKPRLDKSSQSVVNSPQTREGSPPAPTQRQHGGAGAGDPANLDAEPRGDNRGAAADSVSATPQPLLRSSAADADEAAQGLVSPDAGDSDVAESGPSTDEQQTPAAHASNGQPRKRGRLSSGAYYSVETGYRVSASVIARAARVLTEWLSGSGLEQSPRWDAAQLAWRLKALSGIQRARRAELGTPSLMILADVSASCRGFAPRALTVAYALYELGRLSVPMCIVTHSNGEPKEVLTPDKRVVEASAFAPIREADRVGYKNYPAWYARVLARIGATHVVALGDTDAEPTYVQLARAQGVEGLIWLDHHACNHIEPKADKRWRCSNAVRVVGCKDENSLLTGLQIGIKALK